MPEDISFDTDLDRRLRVALEAAAVPGDGAGVTASVARRVARHRRRVHAATTVVVVIVALGGIAAVVRGTARRTPPSDRASAVPSTGAPTPSTNVRLAPGPSSAYSLPPTNGPTYPLYRIPPCPAGIAVPSDLSGQYCGPVPPAGNGLGPGGQCTGREADPPCGPGVVAGRYYAYTLPGNYSGLVIFDGRQWVSELTLPTEVPPLDVWMRLTAAGTLGWIGPRGAVDFVPYTGQPLQVCSKPTSAPAGP